MRIGFEAKRVFHNKTGLGNYSRDLVRILAKYYPENNYFLYNPKSAGKILFEANNENVFEKQPSTSFYKKFYNLWRQKGIIADLKADNIELFHGLSGEIPRGLKQHKIKSIVTIHDLIFVRFPHLYSYIDRKIHRYKSEKAANEADLIIAISEQTKNDIIEIFGVEASKIKVIYQGCHAVFKETFSDLDQQKVIKKFNLPEKFILNVGTIEVRKNVLIAVKAIKNTNIPLVIVGKETAYATEVKSYIAENNLENQVIFLNKLSLSELAMIYQMATIFVYPSFYEGFGIPIIEALYSKTPVITTQGGVFPEAGGPYSIYVDPYNEVALQEKLLYLWNNQNVCLEIASKGHQFVQKFNDESIAKELTKVYRRF